MIVLAFLQKQIPHEEWLICQANQGASSKANSIDAILGSIPSKEKVFVKRLSHECKVEKMLTSSILLELGWIVGQLYSLKLLIAILLFLFLGEI